LVINFFESGPDSTKITNKKRYLEKIWLFSFQLNQFEIKAINITRKNPIDFLSKMGLYGPSFYLYLHRLKTKGQKNLGM